MLVRCSNCQTQFSLDERQVGADGVAVRCAVCRYVFRVEPPEGTATGWRVRTVDGDLFEADDLATLRLWIREGRLHPDDTISRTGKHWIRLGDMPEFSDAFAGFPDLPAVLSSPEGAPLDTGDLSSFGPPPDYAGDDAPTAVAGVVIPAPRDSSEQLDMTGLLSALESDDDRPASGDAMPTAVRESSGPRIAEDAAPGDDVQPSDPPRRAKHQTRRVQTIVPEQSPNDVESDAPMTKRPESDVVQPSVRPESSPSMLGAVTAHVTAEPVRPVDVRPESGAPQPPARRRSPWPLFAGLGLLCGAAVVFGIPQVRDRVFGGAMGTATYEQPEALAVADAAVRSGVSAELHRAMAAPMPDEASVSPQSWADLALARAEVRATESLVLRLVAASTAQGRADAVFKADEAADEAARALAGVDVGHASPERLARTRARVRLAQGRPQDDVLPWVSDQEPELRALAEGASLWSTADARVPSGLISALAALPEPSILAQALLATAYARGGDDVGAADVRRVLEARAPEDPLVQAVAGGEGGQAAAEPPTPEPRADDAPDPVEVEPEDADVAPAPGADPTGPADPPKAAAPKMSIDKLIERGCEKVEGGDVAAGQKLLLKAFDQRPGDLDVLVCLGAANRKKGVLSTALRYYEQALTRSPRFMPALLGAARTATKMGEDDKALAMYRRVLGVSPGNAEAKSYVAKKTAPERKPTSPSSGSEPKTDGDRKPEPPRKAEPPGVRKPEPPKAPETSQ